MSGIRIRKVKQIKIDRNNLNFTPKLIVWPFHNLSILANDDIAIAARSFTSFVDLPESGILQPKYLNCLTYSNCFPDNLTGVLNVSGVSPTTRVLLFSALISTPNLVDSVFNLLVIRSCSSLLLYVIKAMLSVNRRLFTSNP